MRIFIVITLTALALPGCTTPAWTPPPPPDLMPLMQTQAVYPNPVLAPITDPQCVWEVVVDVIDDYFRIQREAPVRQIGGALTEGQIDTFPEVSPTMFEPWRRDTAGEYQRVENTMQTIRRRAVVRVLPAEGGHWVDVAVFKELEDLPQPEHASAGSATFRYDSSFTRVVNPNVGPQVPQGWIPQGRNTELEQRIIGHILTRCNELGYQVQVSGTGFGVQGPVF